MARGGDQGVALDAVGPTQALNGEPTVPDIDAVQGGEYDEIAEQMLTDFSKTVVHLPLDIVRSLRLIRLLDSESRDCTRHADELARKIKNGEPDIMKIREHLSSMLDIALHDRYETYEEAKSIYSQVDNHFDRVNAEIARLKEDIETSAARREASEIEKKARSRSGTPKVKLRLDNKKTRGRKRKREPDVESDDGADDGADDMPVHPNEPTYCICNRVSFGDMLACDNELCPYEWFHLECIGLDKAPPGTWYCDECTKTLGLQKKLKRKGR